MRSARQGRAWLRRCLNAGLGLAVGIGVGACSGGSFAGLAGDGVDPGGDPGGAYEAGTHAACHEGQARVCHRKIGEAEGVVTCLQGEQICDQGQWSECAGSLTQIAAPPPLPETDRPTLALSGVSPCTGDPCDPTCQGWNEVPDGGLTLSGAAPKYTWQVGKIGDLPSGLAAKAVVQPCATAADCQIDQHCDSPVSGTCAHHKCVAGAALDAACDPCVAEVCGVDSTCCASVAPPYKGKCDHDPCAAGAKLDAGCNKAVEAVCQKTESCCDKTWSAACATSYGSQKNVTCAAPSSGQTWSPACVAKVESVCGAFCASDAPCAHDKCYAGGALDATCDACVGKVCQQQPACCTGAWDASCVALVSSACGSSCPSDGKCTAWLPSQTNLLCSGVDLTAGVACGTKIPICNRGTKPAPSGVHVAVWPGNSGKIPSTNPSMTSPKPDVCTSATGIAAGECVDVDCPALAGTREVMVNPPDGFQVAECSYQNNWTEYSAGLTCGAPSCVASSQSATLKPLRMFVSIDKSGSMSTGSPSRWSNLTSALKTFLADPGSAGLGVALRFWADASPSGYPCEDTGKKGDASSCNVAYCSHPLVPFGVLTAATGAADPTEKALVDAINAKSPGGGTPMSAALGGATKWAADYQAAHPSEQAIAVLVTDGEPNGCDNDVAHIAKIAADAYAASGVRTYVIGIQGLSTATLQKIASAGGGDGFFVTSSAQGAKQILQAFRAIQGSALDCAFPLPGTTFDPAAVDVLFTPGSGAPTSLGRVSSPALCGDGWYFDDATHPTEVQLCPSTCAAAQAATSAHIEIGAGCTGGYAQTSTVQTYAAACGAGQRPQWGYLTWEALTPGDSSVEFLARTSDTASFTGTPVKIGTVAVTPPAAPDACAIGDACAIDLYTSLGGKPAGARPHLELTVRLNPSTSRTSAPTVTDWQLTHSCVDAL